METSKVVTHDEWLAVRKKHFAKGVHPASRPAPQGAPRPPIGARREGVRLRRRERAADARGYLSRAEPVGRLSRDVRSRDGSAAHAMDMDDGEINTRTRHTNEEWTCSKSPHISLT